MTGALNVTDSNCKTWPIASVKEPREREGILSLWRCFKVGFLWNTALCLPHKRLCGWKLSVRIEPEVIIVSPLIRSISKPSSRSVFACALPFVYSSWMLCRGRKAWCLPLMCISREQRGSAVTPHPSECL